MNSTFAPLKPINRGMEFMPQKCISFGLTLHAAKISTILSRLISTDQQTHIAHISYLGRLP